MRRKPTHFISVPATPAIQEGLKNFKDLVLNDRDVKIEDAFFQVPEKLHVTICVMTLESDEDRQRAVECLNRVKDTIWRPIFERSGPIKLQFAGLQTFQRNQRHANVVFGKILSANFAVFADEVCQEFVDKHLVERHTLTSQYHLTLLNSHFLDKSIRRITTTFDATRLLDKFRDYSFGEMLVDELHLLRMGARDENGYYEITEKVTLN